tara:strand:- start:279 stop:545 length:267 start_codon:yes stop_codon:yes gene_type:complete
MVFNAFGIGMSSILIDAKDAKEFDEQTVSLSQRDCGGAPFIGKNRASISLILDETFLVETLEHLCHRGSRNCQRLSNASRFSSTLDEF